MRENRVRARDSETLQAIYLFLFSLTTCTDTPATEFCPAVTFIQLILQ